MISARCWMAVAMLAPLGGCDAGAGAPDAGRTDFDSGGGADSGGPAPDLSCLGEPPAPTTGPIGIEGKVFAVVGLDVQPLVDANVVVRRRVDGEIVGQVTTGAEGRFELSLASMAAGADVTLRVDSAGRLPTEAVPSVPLTGAEGDVLLIVADATEMSAWYEATGLTYTGQPTLLTVVVDCDFEPIERSAVVIGPPPAAIAYWDPEARRWRPDVAGGQRNGFSLAADVGSVASITATLPDQAVVLSRHTVSSSAGELTLAVVSPHGR